MWTRKHGLTGNNLRVLESLVKFCLQFYFKIYSDIKIYHLIVDDPYHALTSIRILRTQPKKIRDAITLFVRKGAWYSHPEPDTLLAGQPHPLREEVCHQPGAQVEEWEGVW